MEICPHCVALGITTATTTVAYLKSYPIKEQIKKLIPKKKTK